MVKIACASDIHGKLRCKKLPVADILILAGDIFPNLARDYKNDAEIQRIWARDEFVGWLHRLNRIYEDVFFIPGNHDRVFEVFQDEMVALVNKTGVHCLLDSAFEAQGLKFWGSPWTPWFFGKHWAYNLPPNYNAEQAGWNKIPNDTDVLITHGPPKGILDYVAARVPVSCVVPSDDKGRLGENVGCPYLLDNVMNRVKPRLHVFGHIHEGYGVATQQGIMFVNASIHNGNFKPKNEIQMVNLD